MNETPLIATRELVVEYRTAGTVLRAVDGVDLDILGGRTVGLVGESGSGKSTLAGAIVGLATPTSGQVLLDGVDITHPSRTERQRLAQRMQVIFQDPFRSLNPTLTVGATLSETLRYNLGLDRAAITERVERAVHDVGLTPAVLDRHPSHFSGGQLQRIAIARALVVEPDFVVCDEAVSALDLSVQAQVLNLLRDVARERSLSYLFISHDLDVVRLLSDTIAVMYRGRIVEHGPTAAVATDPRHPYTRQLVAATLVPDVAEQRRRQSARRAQPRLTGEPGVGGCVYAHRCPRVTDRCHAEQPTLQLHAGRSVACWNLSEDPDD